MKKILQTIGVILVSVSTIYILSAIMGLGLIKEFDQAMVTGLAFGIGIMIVTLSGLE